MFCKLESKSCSRHKKNIAHRNRLCKTEELEPVWPVQDTTLQALAACNSTPHPPFQYIGFQVCRLVNLLLIHEPFRSLNFNNITTIRRPAPPLLCDAVRQKIQAGLVARMGVIRNLYAILGGRHQKNWFRSTLQDNRLRPQIHGRRL
jgi:hypothetical protein